MESEDEDVHISEDLETGKCVFGDTLREPSLDSLAFNSTVNVAQFGTIAIEDAEEALPPPPPIRKRVLEAHLIPATPSSIRLDALFFEQGPLPSILDEGIETFSSVDNSHSSPPHLSDQKFKNKEQQPQEDFRVPEEPMEVSIKPPTPPPSPKVSKQKASLREELEAKLKEENEKTQTLKQEIAQIQSELRRVKQAKKARVKTEEISPEVIRKLRRRAAVLRSEVEWIPFTQIIGEDYTKSVSYALSAKSAKDVPQITRVIKHIQTKANHLEKQIGLNGLSLVCDFPELSQPDFSLGGEAQLLYGTLLKTKVMPQPEQRSSKQSSNASLVPKNHRLREKGKELDAIRKQTEDYATSIYEMEGKLLRLSMSASRARVENMLSGIEPSPELQNILYETMSKRNQIKSALISLRELPSTPETNGLRVLLESGLAT